MKLNITQVANMVKAEREAGKIAPNAQMAVAKQLGVDVSVVKTCVAERV